jgi:hypothetical protein
LSIPDDSTGRILSDIASKTKKQGISLHAQTIKILMSQKHIVDSLLEE